MRSVYTMSRNSGGRDKKPYDMASSLIVLRMVSVLEECGTVQDDTDRWRSPDGDILRFVGEDLDATLLCKRR